MTVDEPRSAAATPRREAAARIRAAAARSLALSLERRARSAAGHYVLYRQAAHGLRESALLHELQASKA